MARKRNAEKLKEYNKQYYQTTLKEKRTQERQSKVKTKVCPICNQEFVPKKSNQVYCSSECKKESHRLKGIIYRQTEGYKQRIQSEEFKEYRRNYTKTEQYKEYRRQYAKTETYKNILKKYAQSEKGKATLKRYTEKIRANGWKPLGQTTEG